jgi:energy-coupling factor transporter ATP-binding protein EcfA2
MLNCEIEIKNYRAFVDEHPAKLTLSHETIALVGPNNAGKSSLLRFFWELRSAFQLMSTPEKIAFFASGSPIGPIVHLNASAFTNLNDRPLSITLTVPDCPIDEISRCTYETSRETVLPKLRLYRGRSEIHVQSPNQVQQGVVNVTQIAAQSAALSASLYAGPFRNAIAVTPGEPYYDLDIGKTFIEKFDDFRAGHNPGSRSMARRLISEIKSAFGFKHLNVHASRGNDTLIIEDERGSHTLPEVGAGLSQFIILVFHAAIRNPTLMIIDEPELNLHPALQMKLLSLLRLHADTILFSTHNIGLARSTADRRYLVMKESSGFARVSDERSNPRLVEILGELSFSGRHDLGVNAVLWVEGPNDVPVIQHFLALLGKEHRVLVLPLHGRNGIVGRAVEQLRELKRSHRMFTS